MSVDVSICSAEETITQYISTNHQKYDENGTCRKSNKTFHLFNHMSYQSCWIYDSICFSQKSMEITSSCCRDKFATIKLNAVLQFWRVILILLFYELPYKCWLFCNRAVHVLNNPIFHPLNPPPLNFGTNNNNSAKRDGFWYIRKFYSFPNIRAFLLGGSNSKTFEGRYW